MSDLFSRPEAAKINLTPFLRCRKRVDNSLVNMYSMTTKLSNGAPMSGFKNSDRYQVVWLIRRLFRALGQASDSMLQPLGISAADRAVMEFLYPDQALSVPEIARKYSVSRQHVQVTVNSLAEKNLVSTSDNPKHKRSPLVQLTKQGRKTFASVLRQDQRAIDALFADVSRNDTRITRRTMQSLLERLKEDFEQ